MHGSSDYKSTPDDRLDIALFARYLQGEANSAEAQLVERWAQTEERRQWIAEANNQYLQPDVIGEARVWTRIIERMGVDVLQLQKTIDHSQSHSWRARWYLTVTAAIAFLTLTVGHHITQRQASLSTLSNTVYTTTNGQRARIDLPDGSNVEMNVATRLELSPDYSKGNRALQLDGEAVFTVAPLSGAPFVVTTKSATVRALGTRFAVRQYRTDTTTTVAVDNGKVAVHTAVLTANEQIEAGSHFVGQVEAVHRSSFSFTTGVLTLRNVSLRDAIPDLNRWYDVDIRLSDADLAEKRIGGGFRARSVSDLIAILEITFDVRITQDGRILIINSR